MVLIVASMRPLYMVPFRISMTLLESQNCSLLSSYCLFFCSMVMGGRICDRISKLLIRPPFTESCNFCKDTWGNIMSRFMASFTENVMPGLVNRKLPKRESWNTPIMGALLAGLTIWKGIAAIFFNSVSAITFCGMCIFISSPR